MPLTMPVDTFTAACNVLTQDANRITALAAALASCTSVDEKEAILTQDPVVCSLWQLDFEALRAEERLVLKALMAIRQAEHILQRDNLPDNEYDKRLQELIDCLRTVESFYHDLGGIVGYHLIMTKLLCQPEQTLFDDQAVFLAPPMISIEKMTEDVAEAIYHSIIHLPQVAEIYPVGGAADRLNLKDPDTGISLPAASLCFCGVTLLEGLVRDVQAKEYLYYKLFGKQITVPIAMMTSEEKDNDKRMKALCKEKHYFGRGEKSFFFFCQPLVPTISVEGGWALRGPVRPLLRPGGHGVIWKLARDSGCFSWLRSLGIQRALVRQINNPIAAVDYGLFAFTGYGWRLDKPIGFSSCHRAVGSAEGTNVLVKESKDGHASYTLTNIEYCDLKKFGIADEPLSEGLLYSKYPSNTNILFVDIQKIEEALQDRPIPGMLVNLKNITYKAEDGKEKQQILARLESMMQNISDSFKTSYVANAQPKAEEMPSYITFNARRKTISATKKELQLHSSLMETPEGCFLDMMENACELLLECGFSLLQQKTHPSTILFTYHPALGPLYSIIAQKMRQGAIASYSALHLGIAELDMQALTLDGALVIQASSIMGHTAEDKHLFYSENVGRCHWKNVTVINKGLDRSLPQKLWKEAIYKECCRIDIEGDGELFAEDVTIIGDVHIIVPSGFIAYLYNNQERLEVRLEKKEKVSWFWSMHFDQNKKVVLEKKSPR